MSETQCTPNAQIYMTLHCLIFLFIFFTSLQGETGRPGMPGEKGDVGAMVSDFHRHAIPTCRKIQTNRHISLDLSCWLV